MPVAHWHEQIGDPTIADSILDRLLHNAYRLELKGESMRKKLGRKPRTGGGSMSEKTRFQLKQPTGWFAAGREVACALELLSDATFKLFVWLCLHARAQPRGSVGYTGRVGSSPGQKGERDPSCPPRTRAGKVSVPSRRRRPRDSRSLLALSTPVRFRPSHDSRRYVEDVKRLFSSAAAYGVVLRPPMRNWLCRFIIAAFP